MAHLFVDLYAKVNDQVPYCTLNDCEAGNRRFFYDLKKRGVAHQTARVVVRRGDEYRIGDHIRLLGQVRRSNTDTIVIDPAIAADVDLNHVIFGERSFADRAAALLIVTNPNPDSSYRLRVSLYNRVKQKYPSLILYDWVYSPYLRLANLNLFRFANKTAFIRVEKGPAYQPGDQIILCANLEYRSQSQALDPGDYDLNQLLLEDSQAESLPRIPKKKRWAEAVAGIALELQPRFTTRPTWIS